MPKLIAYAPDERWAYVSDGGRLFLLRPPFAADLEVGEAIVAHAVLDHGFQAAATDFPTREGLLAFLSAESVRVYQKYGEVPSSRDLLARLLVVLTPADLDRQIERARRMVAAGDEGGASTLLDRLREALQLTPEQREAVEALRGART